MARRPGAGRQARRCRGLALALVAPATGVPPGPPTRSCCASARRRISTRSTRTHGPVRRLRVFPQLRPAGRLRTQLGADPRIRRVLAAGRGRPSWTFKIRPDMKWSDGQPATSEDARWTFQLDLDANWLATALSPVEASVSGSSITGSPTPAPPRSSAPTPRRWSSPPTTPPRRSSRPTSRSCPSTSGEPRPTRRWGTRSSTPRSWERARTRRSNGGPASSSTSSATPTTGAPQGCAGRDLHPDLQVGRLDGPGPQGGRDRLRPRRQPGPVRRAQERAEHPDRGRRRRTAAPSSASTPTAPGPASPSKGGGPRRRRSTTRPSATRSATPSTSRRSSTGSSTATATLGTTQRRRRSSSSGTPSRPTSATFNIDMAKQKLEAAGYTLDRQGPALDKEGKPINLRLVVPDSDDDLPEERPVHPGLVGQLGIKITTQVFDSDTLTDLMLPPEAGGAGNKADFDLFIWNWAGDPDPNSLLQIFTLRRDRQLVRQQLVRSRVRPAVRRAEPGNRPPKRARRYIDQMQQIFYDQAPYHVLFYDAELHAYRTDRFGGLAEPAIERHAALPLRHPRLHAADGAGAARHARSRPRPPRPRPRRPARVPRRRRSFAQPGTSTGSAEATRRCSSLAAVPSWRSW